LCHLLIVAVVLSVDLASLSSSRAESEEIENSPPETAVTPELPTPVDAVVAPAPAPPVTVIIPVPASPAPVFSAPVSPVLEKVKASSGESEIESTPPVSSLKRQEHETATGLKKKRSTVLRPPRHTAAVQDVRSPSSNSATPDLSTANTLSSTRPSAEVTASASSADGNRSLAKMSAQISFMAVPPMSPKRRPRQEVSRFVDVLFSSLNVSVVVASCCTKLNIETESGSP
jgi:hypothetical protein